MNRIDITFEKLKKDNKKALLTFLTVGDPDLDVSEKAIIQLDKEGADIIELGVPFSDPSADGPIIQDAGTRAITNGTDIYRIFELVERVRDKVNAPLVFLLYYNIIMQYGHDAFFAECKRVGIDGVIIPDLPFEESDEIAEYTEKYGVYQINLVSPTSKERIKKIARNSKGFLYCISSLGVTGMKSEFNTDFNEFFSLIRKYSDIPACIGFGISNGEQVSKLKHYCDGLISGSAIVNAIATGDTVDERLSNLSVKVADLRSGL